MRWFAGYLVGYFAVIASVLLAVFAHPGFLALWAVVVTINLVTTLREVYADWRFERQCDEAGIP